MVVLSDLRKRWFVTCLCLASAAFFTGALLYSTMTYVDVMEARQGVELMNALEGAEELPDGSLRLTFSIEIKNPSGMTLEVSAMSWTVRVDNSTAAAAVYLPVVMVYNSSSEGLTVPPEGVRTVRYEAVVTDPAKLSAIEGFIAYAASEGKDYTLATAPYVHDYRLSAWTGGFDHDYQYYKEMYLNDIVRIERTYVGGEYL